MNKQLLQQTKEFILREPSRVNMKDGLCSLSKAKEEYDHAANPRCNTVHCVAGTGVLINMRLTGVSFDEIRHALDDEYFWGNIREKADAAFELHANQSDKLYYTDKWPVRFWGRLRRTKPGTQEYAQVVADRIQAFIDTNGMV